MFGCRVRVDGDSPTPSRAEYLCAVTEGNAEETRHLKEHAGYTGIYINWYDEPT